MTATMDPIPRRSLSKKRHTKPCKFFQTMQCPFSAEECDFAHVSVDTCPPPLSVHKRKACRYFMSGHCTQGLWCRFRHGVEGGEEVREKGAPVDHKADHGAKDKSASLTRLEISKYQGPHIQTQTPGFPHSHGYMSWAPYSIPLPDYPHESNCQEDCQRHLTSPTARTNSSDSVAGICTPSESSSSMTDDLVVITHSPVNSFHQSSPDIPTSPFTPNTPVNPISPFTPTTPVNAVPVYAPIAVPYIGDHNSWSPRSPSRSTRSQSQPRPSTSRQKATYKTKSCKFFKPNSICPKGDQCTFVHDPKVMEAKAPTECATSPTHSDEINSETAVDSPVESLEPDSPPKLQHGLPVKPLSLREENKKKGFYPISWRVIGGGVMIGGKGHPLSGQEETPTNIDPTDGDAGLSQATSDMKLGNPKDPTTNKLFISVPSNPIENVEDVISNRKPTPRARAMSIPPTPTSERMDILALFSAESPGGL